MRIHGDNRGWDIVESSGAPVWQFVQGGFFSPLPVKVKNMKKLANMLIILTFLGMASSAEAQTLNSQDGSTTVVQSSAPSTVAHFTLSGSAVAFKGTSSTLAASIGQASFQMTKRLAIGYEQVTVPTLASFDLGVVSYTLPLNALAGKKLSSHFTFDPTQIGVTFQGGIGKVLQADQGVSRIAETVGVYISYPLANHLSLNIIGGQWLHGGVQNGFIVTPSTAAISSGLSISF